MNGYVYGKEICLRFPRSQKFQTLDHRSSKLFSSKFAIGLHRGQVERWSRKLRRLTPDLTVFKELADVIAIIYIETNKNILGEMHKHMIRVRFLLWAEPLERKSAVYH